MIGIYIITNEINEKVYIGQTGKGKTTLIKRLKHHYNIQVIEILKELNLFNGSKKELSKFMKELGLKYNVSDKTINRIRLNESYTHIDRELI